MKHWRSWLSALLAAAMLLSCAGGFAETAQETPTQHIAPEGQLTLAEIEANGATAYTHDGRVTLVDGTCTGEPVRSMEDAAAVVDSMIALLGGGARTRFEPWRTFGDPAGNIYYVFQQMYAETTVSGGAVKVVTNAAGDMLGLVGSVEGELPDIEEAEGISAGDAEALALEYMQDNYQAQAELLEGRTEKTVLPVDRELDMESEQEKLESRFVWVVYTNDPGGRVETGSDLPYLAHYVTMDGEYLYSLPTIFPGDEAATTGYDAAYVFEFMEPVDYTGAVRLSDGTEREITIALMRDSRTGMYYLGNLERRIVVGNCYDFLYDHGRVVLEASADNAGWDNTCLLSLYNYCRAWDYYHEIGWVGGDGLGTPIMILKDYCNSDREPIDNAAYAGHFYGWQVFLSSDINDYAQCLDVLGHEFTHCVTGSVMTYNAYMNDYGAINEAVSDIQGNICEMLTGATEDATWMLGENSAEGSIRSMSDPHQHRQPEFSWDLHYCSNVSKPTPLNDRGGVHANSSLLNNVAWRLCEKGGMSLEEARAFWFAVDCSMVPGTDYAQLSELMPWVLGNMGMERYRSALEAAMDAVRLRANDVPETFDEDRALVTLTLPDEELFTDGHWGLGVVSVDVDGIVQRVRDIWEGNGEYATALEDILNVIFDTAAQQPEEEEQPLTLKESLKELLEAVGEAIEKAGEEADGDDAGGAPEEAEDAAGEEEDAAGDKAEIMKRLMEVYSDYFGDLFYIGTGVAGQDGRTVRLVCRPGMTMPVLYRMEFDNDEHILSVALAVYTFDRWFDVGSLIAPVLEQIGQNSATDDGSAGGAPGLSGLVDGDIDIMKLLSLLSKAKEKLSDPKWIVDRLFFTIEGGAICEIPAGGLEEVASLTPEDYPSLFGAFKR